MQIQIEVLLQIGNDHNQRHFAACPEIFAKRRNPIGFDARIVEMLNCNANRFRARQRPSNAHKNHRLQFGGSPFVLGHLKSPGRLMGMKLAEVHGRVFAFTHERDRWKADWIGQGEAGDQDPMNLSGDA